MNSIKVSEIFALIIVSSMIFIASTRSLNCDIDGDTSECLDKENDQNEPIYESTPLCKSRKRHINPNDLIRETTNDFKFDENFSQTIEVAMCEGEGLPCSGEDSSIKTKCRQKFLSIQLQVFSRNSSLSQLKTFSIPSNCECVYYKPAFRFVKERIN